MFVDLANIYIKAGNGGNGAVAFRREKYIPAGGPAGGNGGKGGDVIIEADNNLRTLMDFKYKKNYQAQSGEDGKGSNMYGKDGEDLIIKVPVGTVIRNNKTNLVIKDMNKSGERFVVAKGGSGGRGNATFKSSIRQAPSFAKMGKKGEEIQISLELKLLADVGLLGFPNVGKSTFLSIVTKANPKVANYHFTTLVPNLGVATPKNATSFVIADIPGIIEGASNGVGLGFDFLRHIQRTKMLIHIADISGQEGRDPLEDFKKVNYELGNYSKVLLDREQIVVANKMDLLYDKEPYEKFKNEIEKLGYKVFPMSNATHEGVDDIINYVSNKLKEIPTIKIFDDNEYEDINNKKLEEKDIKIYKKNNKYIIEGRDVEAILYSVDFRSLESSQYFQNTMEKEGIYNKLRKMGIQEGDIVSICGYEFEFFD